jgi:hypothetical protein
MEIVHRKSTINGIRFIYWLATVAFWFALCSPVIKAAFVSPPPPSSALTFSKGYISKGSERFNLLYPCSVTLEDIGKTEIHLASVSRSLAGLTVGTPVSVGWYAASKELKLGVVVDKDDATLISYRQSLDSIYQRQASVVLVTLCWAVILGITALGLSHYTSCLLVGVALMFIGARTLPYFDHNFTTFCCLVYLAYEALAGPAIRARAALWGQVDYISVWP